MGTGARRLRMVVMLAVALGVALAALVAVDARPASAQVPGQDDPDEVVWLCRPGLDDDPCELELDTTVREPDGGERVETPERAPQDERPVDCFYVYPTVSNQPGPNADRSRDPELHSIAQYQAARFSSVCRVFAPVYRQVTVPALLVAGQLPVVDRDEALETAYDDVLAAWRTYLDEDNDGRGVVLLGHSQGTRMLRALLRREIETDPAQREQLVGAVLLGGNLTVPRGEVVGGELSHVPLCTEPHQDGCIVAYASFAEDPPEDSRYGRVEETDTFGFPDGDHLEVACTDPGPLSGMTDPFGVTVPTEPFAPGFIALSLWQVFGGPPPSASTSWVTPEDRYDGGCATIEGANVLRLEPVGDSRRPNPSPDETWGTHLIDVNLGLERQVEIVRRQSVSWLARQGVVDDEPGPPETPSDPVEPRGSGGTGERAAADDGSEPDVAEGAPAAAPAAGALPATGGAPLAGAVLLLAAALLRGRAGRRPQAP